MADHGTLTRYRNGCHDGPGGKSCAPCRAANAAARRRLRAKNPNARTSAQSVGKGVVVAMPTPRQAPPEATPPVMGEVENAVREQCAAVEAKGDSQAGIRASAIKLASLIDDPNFAAQIGQNVAKLQKLLDALGKPKRKSQGSHTLATVSAMAGRRTEA